MPARLSIGPSLLLLTVALILPVALAACGGSDRADRRATTGAGAAGSDPSGNLTVFAASSLTDAFTELGQAFQKAYPRVNITFNFAASTALRTQIEQGARADVFASADQVQMDRARRMKLIDGPDRVFARNSLVLIYPTGNPGRVSTLHDLARPGLKLVLTDRHVPIGVYARTALEKMSADPAFGGDFAARVLANLKSEEANVRAVVTRVQLGEADAAIVYTSDVTPALTKDVRSIVIPDRFNTAVTYPIAVVRDARNRAAAQAFIAFVRAAPGQEILKKWNFTVDATTGTARSGTAAPVRQAAGFRGTARPREGAATARSRYTGRHRPWG